MRMSNRVFGGPSFAAIVPLMAATVAWILVGGAASAAPVLVDHFDSRTTNLSVAAAPVASDGPVTVAAPIDCIGGFRTATLTKLTESSGSTATLQIEVDPVHHFMNWEEGDAETGTVDLLYDAGGAGLGGIDITGGGTNDSFVFAYYTDALAHPFSVTATVTDTTAGMSTLMGIVPGALSGTFPNTYTIPFAALVGTADLTDIDSIEFLFDSTVAGGPNGGGGDYFIDAINTGTGVPEPVTMAGVFIGLGCLTRYARRRMAK